MEFDTLQGLLSLPAVLAKQRGGQAKSMALEYTVAFDTHDSRALFSADLNGGVSTKPILFARETRKSGCGRSVRELSIALVTGLNQEILSFYVPLPIAGACFAVVPGMSSRTMYVKSGASSQAPGRDVGHIRQTFSMQNQIFHVHTADKQAVFRIVGPLFSYHQCRMSILDETGDETGYIQRRSSEFVKDVFDDEDSVVLVFPQGSDAQQRGLLIAAMFLVFGTHL
ncbi:hypothetical protein RI367_000370 [Sorochytrium milnesiophthora]